MRKDLWCLFLLLTLMGFRDIPSEDGEQEARAMRLFETLSCPVCEGQPLSGSSAELAGDIRNMLRRRMEAGDTDEEIVGYLEGRYGDSISLRPHFEGTTLLLWSLPVLFFMVAVCWCWGRMRRG